jgi:5-(carboxyamino)imidazole ribonucleotide mutase
VIIGGSIRLELVELVLREVGDLETGGVPPGIPVATVAIDGAENAALLAVQILSLKYNDLKLKLKKYRNHMAEKIAEADKTLQKEIKI